MPKAHYQRDAGSMGRERGVGVGLWGALKGCRLLQAGAEVRATQSRWRKGSKEEAEDLGWRVEGGREGRGSGPGYVGPPVSPPPCKVDPVKVGD